MEDGKIMQKNKVVLLGDQYVGKTSLINRFTNDTFLNDYSPTIGLDYFTKIVEHEGHTIKLQVWDTAGQERFRSFTSQYLTNATAAIVMYDVTIESSFSGLSKWVEEVRNVNGEAAIIFIVGNKIDIEDKREITQEQGKKIASDLNCDYAEVSARTGEGVSSLFEELVRNILGKSRSSPPEVAKVEAGSAPTVQIGSVGAIPAERKKGCCG